MKASWPTYLPRPGGNKKDRPPDTKAKYEGGVGTCWQNNSILNLNLNQQI